MTELIIKNSILLTAGILNLAMSLFIISRGWKNKVNLYFSLFTFFTFLWALGLIFVNAGISEEVSRFFASFVYPVALLIIVNVFYFTIYFPYKIFDIQKFYKRLIRFFIVVFTIFCIGFYKIFVYKVVLIPEIIVYYEFWSYTLYSVVLSILMLSSIGILFYKYKKAEGVFRPQLLLVLLAIIMGVLAGGYFNLFLMYFHNYNYDHLGPL